MLIDRIVHLMIYTEHVIYAIFHPRAIPCRLLRMIKNIKEIQIY